MSIYLQVPYVTQLSQTPGASDPTGCWYASACMIGYYFEVGPRLGVPEIYDQGHAATGTDEATERLNQHKMRRLILDFLGVPSGERDDLTPATDEHELLASREHLVAVPDCATAHNYTMVELEKYLRKWGPIFFYWMKTAGGSTYGHACVLIGTDDKDKKLIYHDPENLPNSRMTVADFNSKRQKWKYSLMRKDR